MAVNLVSPGVKIREVDLTIGRIDLANDQVAAFVGPFEKGPVNLPVLIQTEQQLIDVFGKPRTEDDQNKYWLTASNYLSYGGVLQLVRADSTVSGAMGNAHTPVGVGSTGSVKVRSVEDFNNKLNSITNATLTQFYFAAKNPGTWANNLDVYTIDGAADQIVSGINTASIQVGYGVSVAITSRNYADVGFATTFNGSFRGIITGVGNSSIDVKLVSRFINSTATSEFIDYSQNNPLYSIQSGDSIQIINSSNSVAISTVTATSTNISDWYNAQSIQIGNSTILWRNIAERPSTSQYVNSNGGKNDEFNIIVVDTEGRINGIAGEILESFTKLSKARDGKVTPSRPTYYIDFIRDSSSYLFAGVSPTGVSSRFNQINNYSTYTGGAWGNTATGTFFNVTGKQNYKLRFGSDYTTSGTNYGVTLSDIISGYSVFENPAEYPIDFIINGPSGSTNVFEAQAKANYIISLVEARKDCMAVISAFEGNVVNQSNSRTQTDNIVNFFNGVNSSTYAVYDSGYKYTYDRFNNKFMYLACNSDIAGLMARTAINQYPWYSPAGTSRGVISNAIKLAYNPSEAQRNLLYEGGINPVIAATGQGIFLYGDKTASSYQSAFDRINVRRLFLTIEKNIERFSRSQLFEFNDPITRNNFLNIVEPYLRDVRAKRGITEFLVICDESNNTPDVIDSSEFKADIYVKPSRSINFIGLTFVATRTGISFSEIVGTV